MDAADDAKSYYGYLFDAKRQPTKVLDALLRGIADHISEKIGDTSDKWLRPEKMAAFYREVGGNYDSFFVDTPPTSISWIYASIGCEHILLPTDDCYAPPSVPSLTIAGFVRWQCIEILLGPEEHVPFIQESLRLFDIRHPETNKPFPTNLPIDAFPLIPDHVTERWHENCAKLLRLRSVSSEKENSYSSMKSNYQNTNSAHEVLSPCPKEYDQDCQKTRLRPTKIRCFSNLNVRSATSPDDLGLHEIVVEAKASRRPRQRYFRRNSIPTWPKEQIDTSPEMTNSKLGGKFSTQFGIHNNKSKFFYSRYSSNYEDEIISRISNSTRHLKVEAEKKSMPRSLRLNHQTRCPSTSFSTHNSCRKFSPKGQEKYLEEYVRSKQMRKDTPDMTIYERDKYQLYCSHNENVAWKSKVPVDAISDDTLIEKIRESVRNQKLFPNLEMDINSSAHMGKKIKNFDEIHRRKKFQD